MNIENKIPALLWKGKGTEQKRKKNVLWICRFQIKWCSCPGIEPLTFPLRRWVASSLLPRFTSQPPWHLVISTLFPCMYLALCLTYEKKRCSDRIRPPDIYSAVRLVTTRPNLHLSRLSRIIGTEVKSIFHIDISSWILIFEWKYWWNTLAFG